MRSHNSVKKVISMFEGISLELVRSFSNSTKNRGRDAGSKSRRKFAEISKRTKISKLIFGKIQNLFQIFQSFFLVYKRVFGQKLPEINLTKRFGTKVILNDPRQLLKLLKSLFWVFDILIYLLQLFLVDFKDVQMSQHESTKK